eukprot:bmy_14647T0
MPRFLPLNLVHHPPGDPGKRLSAALVAPALSSRSRSSPSSPPSGFGHPGTEPPALVLRGRASPCVSAPKATSKPRLRA